MDHIEAKREQARQHRGVWYDSRADKFVAEVYSRGERHFLGHFATAEDAASAYAIARAEMPTGRGDGDTFVKAFQSFLDTCERDGEGAPLRDEVMIYKEQQFLFNGVVFRSPNKRKRPFYHWESNCSVCSAPYDTLTATRPDVAKGITRTCEDHRRGGRGKAQLASEARGAAPARKEPAAPSVPQEWLDLANAACDTLSLVSDEFNVHAFLDLCKDASGRAPNGFVKFLYESPQSPVVRDGVKLFPRNT